MYQNYHVEYVKWLHGIRKIARDNLVHAKEKSKTYYDRKVHVVEINVGDLVSLLSGKKPKKLQAPYTGPYRIIQKMKNSNLQIMSVANNSIDTVNSERLKHFHEQK